MASNSGSQKKTYVSTLRLNLKPSAPQQRETQERKRVENGTVVNIVVATGREDTPLKTGTVARVKAADAATDSQRKRLSPQTKPTNKGQDAHKSKKAPVVEFLSPQEQVEICIGQTAKLLCEFNSPFPVASCWIHNRKKVVVESQRVRVENSRNSSTLIISEVLSLDAGRYSLFVRNYRGTAQHTITLSVVDRPDPPASCPFVSQLTSSSLVLSWSGPGYDGGLAVTGYQVECRKVGPDQPGDWTELTSHCKNTSYRIRSGLDPQGEYCFRVRAQNAVGASDPSEESDCIRMETAGISKAELQSYVDVVVDTKHRVQDHYNIHEKLGVGKFGQVFRLTHKETGRVYAGKFYRGRGSKEKAAARKEIQLMNELHHPKLVQCLGAYDIGSEIVMIMEYIAGGELFERIVDDNFEHTEPTSARYMKQILEGIQYIHEKTIVHLDLKPENIVCVNTTGTLIKIIDFGLASKLEPGTPLMVLHGTPEFVAPEVINYEPVYLATDMWSIGVICYILLSGESPFQGNSDAETLALVTAAKWEFDPESFDDITAEAKDFISSLLKKDVRARLSCADALAHPWMASFSSHQGRVTKSLNKEKMRHFLVKQKWKKTGKAVLALNRMALLSNKSDTSDSPASPTDNEAEQAVQGLDEKLKSEPRFHQVLSDITEPQGSTVRMACHIYGYPDPEVVWLQDGELLEETERVRIEYEESGLCTLILTDVKPEDSGIYKCQASNSLGQALCSAKLSVEL
ncbi:myosin light chain kinase, smooth muscle-like [Chanos chanos]|uniref:Myosin light chain kinase, smooth muscle-like n=1 Tax=Chanos chanos TaxID=29144 RepID=A0A6J2UUT7_CHACN|nr:myosin light chain kinase, smooth muscle-like [Chanos chanos]